MKHPTIHVEQILTYDDGRLGHQKVRAEVLAVFDGGFIAQFEDRADTTKIMFHEHEWMKHITFEPWDEQICGEECKS